MLQVSSQKENAMGDVLPSVGKELHKNLNPQQSMRFAAHGYELLQKRDLDAAKKELGKALAADPGNPYALINMATACELGGENIAAFRYYQQVIATGTSIVVDISGGVERKGVPLLVLAREGMERIRSLIPAP
jgi:tetratricopeptide (TPR) repeat protein